MARGLWVKTSPYNTFSSVKNFFVKVSQASWVSISDAWVKVSPTSWVPFFSAPTSPDSPIEILNSFNTSEEIRLQGKNYHWTPTPTTLQYKFSVVNGSTAATQDIIAFTTTSNPSTGSSLTLPSSTTYQTITKAGGYYYQGVNNIYRFTVKATTASGSTVETKAEYNFRIPAAPTLSVTSNTSTSATLSITAASTDDYIATGRYIIYRHDSTSGTVYGTSGGTNGLGGIGANSNTVTTTLTGLVSGRAYTFSVLPITGASGYNTTNYTGYPGILAELNYTLDTGYTFSFGNDLYVSTNGYIGINGTASAQGTDALPSTGEYLAIMARDLQQSSTTSIWYWSDTSQYIIRWEGYDYNAPASTKTYQVIFYSGQNYADVYVILKNGSDGSTIAHYKNGTIKSSYSAALTTGDMRRVYFDGTAPTTVTGLTEKSKTGMKQVTGLTSGTTDVGYTTLTTATNQAGVLQTPTITGVTMGSPGGTITVTVSGGGPTYQIYWSYSSTAPSNTVTPDGTSTDTTISDSTGPTSLGTAYVYARSAASTTTYGSTYTTAPTEFISSWSSNAQFTVSATRTLSFNANGGSGAPASQTGTDTGNGATITISSTAPTRTGYTFNGWNTNSSGTGTNYSAGGSITLTADVTLYAKWTAVTTTTTTTTPAPTTTTTTTTTTSCVCAYSDLGTRYYSPNCCPTGSPVTGVPGVSTSSGPCCPDIPKTVTTTTTTTTTSSYRLCTSFDVRTATCTTTGCDTGGCGSGSSCTTGSYRCSFV